MKTARREQGARMIAEIRQLPQAEQEEALAQLLGDMWAYAKVYGDALEMIRSHLRGGDSDAAWREAGKALAFRCEEVRR